MLSLMKNNQNGNLPKYGPFSSYFFTPMVLNVDYKPNTAFAKCSDNILDDMEFVKSMGKYNLLYKNKNTTLVKKNSNYMMGFKSNMDSMIEGIYKLYKQKLNDLNLFNEIIPALPIFKGCMILSEIDNKKVEAKGCLLYTSPSPRD